MYVIIIIIINGSEGSVRLLLGRGDVSKNGESLNFVYTYICYVAGGSVDPE